MVEYSLLFDISFKNPKFTLTFPRILALSRSRLPWASSGRSWRGRGYLFRNFVLFNLTFQTCNLEVFCPFQNLSSDKPEYFTFKLQVWKVRLTRTNFTKRYPRPPQEWLGLAQGGRDQIISRIWRKCMCKLGIFKENVKKATENFATFFVFFLTFCVLPFSVPPLIWVFSFSPSYIALILTRSSFWYERRLWEWRFSRICPVRRLNFYHKWLEITGSEGKSDLKNCRKHHSDG